MHNHAGRPAPTVPILLMLLAMPALTSGLCLECYSYGPSNATHQPQWLAELKANKSVALRRINYTGGVFEELLWTQTSYMQTQMHPYDRFFYDPVTGNYTVQKFLDDLQVRYGGVDAILLWPTYTNIGVDDRNQYDYWRAMPGGLSGLKKVIQEVRSHGVRVLMPYNPWDQYTRPEGKSDEDTLAELLQELDADGFNGDTMNVIPKSFWDASRSLGRPIALEAELAGSVESLNWATMGWGYWEYPAVPVVDRLKYFSSGKFMTNVCNRWMKRKVDDLQFAFFNGDGYETWENIWGIWNGIVPRDAEAIKRMATMLRFFGQLGFLQSPDWVPHSSDVVNSGYVYASRWPKGNATLWTMVNRGPRNLSGPQLIVPNKTGYHFYDCYHGQELAVQNQSGNMVSLSFEMEVEGFGCVLALPNPADGSVANFLDRMQNLTRVSLLQLSADWTFLPQTMVEISKTPPATEAPPGMVLVPRCHGLYRFATEGVEVEGHPADGVDFQFPWEGHPMRAHDHEIDVGSFYMDKYPVTIANYSQYLKATGYRPADPENWLKNWNGSLEPPATLLNHPVTYVGLEEARAYCKWAHGGSRLPHSWEWQYAAQGGEYGRRYPWGQEPSQDHMPKMHHSRTFGGAVPVTSYSPQGDSPFGISDLVGNVWQYTDEFQDAHTRAVMLRGGSNYVPAGSEWYFPQARDLVTHQKYMLFSDRYERAGTVGFRCVKDVADHIVEV